jgi:hypothetical protein
MANRKLIPPDPKRPEPSGGTTRKSVRVDLGAYPAVERRQALNAKLLDGVCGHSTGERSRFGPEDVALLELVARERFGAEQVLLRQQALRALGQTGTLAAAEALARLSASSVEDPSARGAALAAIVAAAPALGRSFSNSLIADDEMRIYCNNVLAEVTAKQKKRKRRAPQIDRR